MKKNMCTTIVTFTLALTLLLSGCAARQDGYYNEGAASSAPMPASDEPLPDSEDYDGDDYAGEDYATSGEQYLVIDENAAKATEQQSLITFSLKVDTAAYTNVARYIESGNLPPKDAVRTEELINYFRYDGDMDFAGEPFAIHTEVGPSPFDESKHMAFIRVKTEELAKEELPASNLTFLIDTSGSMNSHDKLPLLKEAFTLLVETLDEDDIVSIVTYAGSSGVALDSVGGDKKDQILGAINGLSASGSTAGAGGIMAAYALAEKNYMPGGNNRIILATDGDFNVGISDVGELEKLVAEKRDNGVYMSVLGFGTGNIREDIMETLSKHGSGNYSYINSVSTANKVLVEELGTNLFTVADDVKAQVEFNPATVKSYRLIGYENRRLKNEDFDDDTKDAGEIGAGTDVVVMFELELTGSGSNASLKYNQAEPEEAPDYADELFEVRIRYKDPGESESQLLVRPVTYGSITATGSDDYRFACSVAAFGHLLRGSEYTGDATISDVIAMAEGSLGRDNGGYRGQHLELLQRYRQL